MSDAFKKVVIQIKNPPPKILKRVVNILKYAGLYENEGERDRLYYVRYFYKYISLGFVLNNAFLTHNVDLFYNHSEVLYTCELLIWIFVATMMASKVGILFKTKTSANLVHKIERIYSRVHFKDVYERNLLRKTQTLCDRVSLIGPTIYPGLVALFNILSIPKMRKKRAIPIAGWFPYMVDESPYFEMGLCFWIFFTTSAYFLVALCDTFLLVLLMRVKAQFKILNNNLRNIRQRSVFLTDLHNRETEDNTAEKNTNHLSSLMLLKPDTKHNHLKKQTKSRPNKMFNGDLTKFPWNDGVVVKVKSLKVKQKAVPNTTLRKSISYNKASRVHHTLDQEMQRQLADCVDLHKELISFTKDLEAAFNPILVVQLACNLMGTGVIGIYTTMVPSMDEKGWALVQILVALIIQLYLFCWLSDQVTEESFGVKEAIYASEWLEASDSFKRSMRVIISRANQPVIITTARYIPLSMETFYKVTKTAYSNYMTLRTFMKT